MSALSPITEFRGKYRFLSNFYPTPHCPWQTVEHFFQASKALTKAPHKHVLTAPSPSEAKRRGARVILRPDWEEIKVDVMRDALALKFAYDSPLANMLLATEHRLLIEGNTWGDTFWGQCKGFGHNMLGVLLMERRGVLLHMRENDL